MTTILISIILKPVLYYIIMNLGLPTDKPAQGFFDQAVSVRNPLKKFLDILQNGNEIGMDLTFRNFINLLWVLSYCCIAPKIIHGKDHSSF